MVHAFTRQIILFSTDISFFSRFAVLLCLDFFIFSFFVLQAELDVLVTQFPHSHLITCPVIGTPIVAEKSQLLLVMSGEYRSKQEVGYLLVPAVGRKIIDLGGDVQKCRSTLFPPFRDYLYL